MAVPTVVKKKAQPTTYQYPKGTNVFTHLGTLKGMTQNSLRAPSAPTPAAYAPTQANVPTGGLGNVPTADPRDASYFNDIAKLDQYYQSHKTELDVSGQNLARDLAKNNQLLDEQNPKDRLAAQLSANKSGLFYSGALGKNLGEIEKAYARRKADLQTEYGDKTGAIARQRQDLEANYGGTGLIRNDVLNAAIARQTAADQANAAALAAQQQSVAAPVAAPFVPSAAQTNIATGMARRARSKSILGRI